MSAPAASRRLRRLSGLLLAGLLACVAIAPLWILFGSHDPTALRDGLDQAGLRVAFLRTAAVTLLACGLASLLALPAALLAHRRQRAWDWSIRLFAVLSLAVPPVLTAAGLQWLLDELAPWLPTSRWISEGLGNTGGLLVAVYALHYFPLILAGVGLAGRERVQAAIDTAAALGCGRLATWRRLVLPLLLPGYLLGTAIAALRMLEDAATALAVGAPDMLATRLLHAWQGLPAHTGELPATALLLLGISGLIVLLAWSSLDRPASTGGSAMAATARPLRPRLWADGLMLMTLLVALLPYLAAIAAMCRQLALLPPQLGSAVFDSGLPSGVFALFTGLLLALVATAAVAAGAGRDGSSRLLSGTLTLLLALPAMLLAMAWWHGLDAGGPLPATAHLGWLLLAALVALKLLPLARHLVVALLPPTLPDLRDTARALPGPRAGRYLRGAMRAAAAPLLLCVLIGIAGLLAEVNIALALLQDSGQPLAAVLFAGVRDGAGWGPAALPLVVAAVVLGLLITTLWQQSARRLASSRLPGDDAWLG